MDLIGLLRKTFDLLKSNLILFLPPLVTSYLVPTILGVVAIMVFVPVLVAAANYPNFVSSLMSGAIVGGTIMVVVAITLWVGILAGQANMNKKVVLTGKASFDDFREGVRKYFARILGGHIVLFLIYLLLILTGLGLGFLMVWKTIPDLVQRFLGVTTIQEMVQRFSGGKWNLSAVPLTVWLEVLKLLARFSGVVLGLATIGFLIYLFTLFWIQACVIEEVGLLKAIRMSCGFVARNFYTAIGYLGLYIIANGFTSRIFPGGGGGGGWGGVLKLPFISLTGGGGFGFGIPAPLEAVFTILITTFFTLLLYVVYADRTGKIIAGKPPSVPPSVFRSIKRE